MNIAANNTTPCSEKKPPTFTSIFVLHIHGDMKETASGCFFSEHSVGFHYMLLANQH